MVNRTFLEKAEALRPTILHERHDLQGSDKVLGNGDEVIFDFSQHYVGYLSIDFESVGHHQDAPFHFQVQFAEMEKEFREKAEEYKGWISPSWIQEEKVHMDVLPETCHFQRRYAFRFVKVKVLAVSSNYKVRVRSLSLDAVSSASPSLLLPFHGRKEDERLDAVSIRTLHECMQEVFEDGPKRDRRLWLGDLRLQALANYETYRNNDLVKRCLYLFAGSTLEDGRVASNIFIHPAVECDYQASFDYSLLFINTLLDYYNATGDMETLIELEPTARRQYEILRDSAFLENNLVDTSRLGLCVIDWNLTLDKEASAQGVYLYAGKALVEIEELTGKETLSIREDLEKKAEAARTLYSKEKGLFLRGMERHISYASQVWLALGGVADASALIAVEKCNDAVAMVSPYMFHHYIDACIRTGRKEKAYSAMTGYWGGMIKEGADTFFELFNPDNPDESPYGGTIVNSYCHAWSCTPTYFLRRFFS